MTVPTATASGLDTAPGRPVVAVDVDDVLQPDDTTRAQARGYRPHHNGPGPTGKPVTGTV